MNGCTKPNKGTSVLTAKVAEARHIALCEQLCMLQTWAERRHISILQCGGEGVEN